MLNIGLTLQALKPGAEGLAAKKLQRVLNDIKIAQDGDRVTLKGQTDASAVALALIVLGPRMAAN